MEKPLMATLRGRTLAHLFWLAGKLKNFFTFFDFTVPLYRKSNKTTADGPQSRQVTVDEPPKSASRKS
jgi:hypothetical protein